MGMKARANVATFFKYFVLIFDGLYHGLSAAVDGGFHL